MQVRFKPTTLISFGYFFDLYMYYYYYAETIYCCLFNEDYSGRYLRVF